MIYVELRDTYNVPELINMAKERASNGARPLSITVIGLGEPVPGKEALRLREYVGRAG
jgi:hypothetical protein